MITGKVIDQKQQPIPGVNLAVMKSHRNVELRTDVYSYVEGKLYACLPADTTGPWAIEIVDILCTSPIVDASCKYSGNFSINAFSIMVPDDFDIPLIFTYNL